MHLLFYTLFAVCSLLLSLYVIISRFTLVRGRIMVRGADSDYAYFAEQVEPKLGISEERAQWTFPLLVQATIALQGFLLAALNLGRPFDWEMLLQQAAILLINIIVFGQAIPYVIITRTNGRWMASTIGILRVSILVAAPLVSLSQMIHHIATLGGPTEEESEPATPTENIEALIDAGEEEGLIQEDDRKLIQSVVEFGDKTARDVMTPRPEIVAISSHATLDELKRALAEHRFTRLPVYEQDLDHIIGFIHSSDLFAVPEQEHATQTVQQILRSISFVPETKRVPELLQELQTGSHMAMVVDEYGMVAGLVTVEDMVEEIVGEIRDEHDEVDVLALGGGAFSVPGSLSIDRLQEMFPGHISEDAEATTVAGLVTGELGHVPAAGEALERDGLRFRVTESNGRRITRLEVAAASTGDISTAGGQGSLFASESAADSSSEQMNP